MRNQQLYYQKQLWRIVSSKQFLNAGTQELRIKKSPSRKLRALVLTRASVELKLKEKNLDKGMQNLSNKSVYTNTQYIRMCVCIYE